MGALLFIFGFIGGLVGLVLLYTAVVYYSQSNTKHSVGRYFQSALHFNRYLQPLAKPYKEALQRYSSFYNLLSYNNKKKFEKRLKAFIISKQFVGRGIAITAEMKALIGASAVQLTFGLPPLVLRHFDKILVYPDNYYSNINKAYHKGEVNPMHGIIVFSWYNFVQGNAIPDDAINLGLHEMAHALRLENQIKNGESDFLDREVLIKWEQQAKRKIQYLQNGGNSIFRAYGKTDLEEFFAVAVEAFFEKPEHFAKDSPELFQLLKRILKQDPSYWA